MKYLISFWEEFWNLSIEMAPWLLLGLLISGILHVFLPENYISKELGKPNFSSILKAVLLGIPLPLCSCGVIPTSIHLYKNGASKSTTNAFLIATPQTGIDSILASYAMLGLPFAILRPLLALFSGIFGGFFTSFFEKSNDTQPKKDTKTSLKTLSFQEKIKAIYQYAFVEMLADLAKWLLIGLVLAALFSLLLPEQFFQEYVPNYFAQMALIVLISLPLYVCATGSIPIALVLLTKGLDPSLVVLFLMIGPATNIASAVLLMNSLGKKTYGLYLFSIAFAGIISSVVIKYCIPYDWLMSQIPVVNRASEMNHHSFFNILLTLLLFVLILKLFIFNNHTHTKMEQTNLELTVEGMTCNHCKANVERNLSQISGVDEVEADYQNNKVLIKGNPTVEEVKKLINELGYKVKD